MCGCQTSWNTYRCCAISDEWEPCTPLNMRSSRNASKAYTLFSGKSPSKRQFGYKLPYRIPDGNYRSNQSPFLAFSCRAPALGQETFGQETFLNGCPRGDSTTSAIVCFVAAVT